MAEPMHRHRERPACWTGNPTGRSSPFPMPGDSRACSQAESPRHWTDTLDFTPGCSGCWRAYLAITRWSGSDRAAWMRGRRE